MIGLQCKANGGDYINLTGGEWSVMECLWEEEPRTVTQLSKYLKESVGWAKSTSITMVTRMEAKGLVYFEDGSKAKLYYPAVRREDAVTQETKNFLGKVYRGSVGVMMNAMVDRKELTKEEIDELYAILGKAEEGKKDD